VSGELDGPSWADVQGEAGKSCHTARESLTVVVVGAIRGRDTVVAGWGRPGPSKHHCTQASERRHEMAECAGVPGRCRPGGDTPRLPLLVWCDGRACARCVGLISRSRSDAGHCGEHVDRGTRPRLAHWRGGFHPGPRARARPFHPLAARLPRLRRPGCRDPRSERRKRAIVGTVLIERV